MRKECMQAVARALGRDLNQAESKEIESRVNAAARRLAQKDPAAWQAKSKAEKLAESGQEAAFSLIGEAKLKAQREALQIAADARTDQRIADLMAKGFKVPIKGRTLDRLDAIDRVNAFHGDQKSEGTSVESEARGISRDFLRQLIPVMEASNPKWFGLLENVEGVTAITKAIYGETQGIPPEAIAGAKIWKAVTEQMRTRMNRAGGDIGKLDDWGAPQHHSQIRVAKAGREEWLKTLPLRERQIAKLANRYPPRDYSRAKWVADILPKLKREKYVNEDGTRMTDAQVTDFLKEAWLTIATGGANKSEPGQFRGNGMRANRGNAERSIHFKDAQSYIDYQGKYGQKSLYEILTDHVENLAKDIALVETWGPNADLAVRRQLDTAYKEAAENDPGSLGTIRKRRIRSENLYNEVSGKRLPVASERLAHTFDTLRNWITSARLGGAAISSITDEGTLHLVGHTNNLPALQLMRNELAAFNPLNKKEEQLANRAGLALNAMISSLNRFGQDSLSSGSAKFSRRLANGVLRVSGLNAMTEARKRAFGTTMLGALGRVAKDHATIGHLDAKDAAILKSKGVTEENFRIWKQADLEDWGGGNDTQLTPDSIYRVPDLKVDSVIGGRIQKLKDAAKAQVDELKARDVEDRGWVAARAQKLSDWVTKAKAKVDAELAKADAGAKGDLTKLRTQVSNLEGNIDALAESWKNPADANTPGIENRQDVGFYGKAALRSKGVNEGKAREAISGIRSDIAAVKRSLESTRLGALKEFFSDFRDRQADLADFTKESNARIGKRAKVMDRITREIDPAISDMRTQARESAATKLLAMVLEETDMAVIEPGAKERAIMGANLQRGTMKGELTKSMFLFKSFPLAMLMRHWGRGLAMSGKSRAAYIATLIATTTVLGAISMQAKEILAGRDPRDMSFKNGKRNWIKAMLQGGSLGIYGDFLFSDSTQHGQSPTAAMMGPVIGTAEQAFNLTQGNLVQLLMDKDTKAGAETIKFAQGLTPGGNLWYTKTVLDHLFWNRLAEYASPGYLAKMRRRSEKEFEQKYFYPPDKNLPDRAPDLTAVAGK